MKMHSAINQRTMLAVAALLLMAMIVGKSAVSILMSNLAFVRISHNVTREAQERWYVSYVAPPINGNLGRSTEALARAAISVWPPSPMAHGSLGWALIAEGRYAEAAEAFKTGALWGNAGAAMMAGNALMYAGDHDAGLALWMEAMSRPPERLLLAQAVFNQANWADYHPERWDDAIRILRATLEMRGLSPADSAPLYLYLTQVYQLADRLDDAQETARQALAIQPSNPDEESALAWVLLDSGKDQEALQQADAALADGADWRGQYVRAAVHLRHCDLATALGDLAAGLSFSPNDYRFYWQYLLRGRVYWEEKNTSAAIDQWETYLQFQPGDLAAREQLAYAQGGQLPRRCGN